MNVLKPLLPAVLHDSTAACSFSAAVICVSVYWVGVAIYRLYLSPLAGFPGSKVAAATHLYEFYHDWWRQGKYIFEIERMHKIYGS